MPTPSDSSSNDRCQAPATNPRKECVFLFVHIPKCLGTTLTNAIGARIKQSIHLYDPQATRDEIRTVALRLLKERRIAPQDLRVIHGHAVFEALKDLSPRPPYFFTFLRNPAERHLSAYHYMRSAAERGDGPRSELYRQRLSSDGKIMDYPDWIEAQPNTHNLMSTTLYCASAEAAGAFRPRPTLVQFGEEHLSVAKRFLERMRFIGFVEDSAQDLPAICKLLGIRSPRKRLNVSEKYFSFDDNPRIMQRVRDLNAVDEELVDFARNWSRSSHGEFTMRLAS